MILNTANDLCACRRRLGACLLAGLAMAGVLAGGCAKQVGGPPPIPQHRLPPVAEGPRTIEHLVLAGETLTSIADIYYGDPGHAGAIAKDNGIDAGGVPAAGSTLRLRFSSGQWDEAQRRAAALVPYNEGVDLFAAERLGEAEDSFRLALDTAPDLLAARYNLALVLLKRGRTDEALTLLEDLTKRRPRDPDFRFARGNALFQTARFADAATQFRQVLTDHPQDMRAAFGYARSLQEAGQTEAAVAAWESYLVLDPDSSWAATARRNLESLRSGSRR